MEGNRAGSYDVREDEGKGEQKQYFNVYHPNALTGISSCQPYITQTARFHKLCLYPAQNLAEPNFQSNLLI